MKFNKFIKSMLVMSSFAMLAHSFAGEMAETGHHESPTLTPYISAEVFPVWTKFGSFSAISNGETISHVDSQTIRNTGGRLSAGLDYEYTPIVHLLGEAGWAYYGRARIEFAPGNNATVRQDGLDFLFGIGILTGHVEWFAKIGGVVKRNDLVTNKFTVTDTSKYSEDTVFIVKQVKDRSTAVNLIPEVKVGALYELNHNWGLSIAYAHAFGESPGARDETNYAPGFYETKLSTNTRGNTTDAVFFGVRYLFAPNHA